MRCHEDGYLVPLAIQLFVKRDGDEINHHPVWTPNDLPNDWLLAKMFFNNASGQVKIIFFCFYKAHLMHFRSTSGSFFSYKLN